ncbi:hypothetical protein EN851_11315 [Mesorhizobium sp. M8A.F.Ca.ET.208.01.1.1]|uniref:hypothetical protein n=1 Tax=unclassified Mesorhizobium TaxID=325217 RepID=UPI0010934DD2|nr:MULTISPECIES: hypothetical protein [unclassified Mesorhizobium]TGQ92181.1 hypothetical protein EN851_11315 [Mesorhizobium sp. M8A.F.Ca.ET.208.01.1.1]TGT52081.1 hypothetical protein EN810_11305 [Mesorhizobium sp. M8A.F.Ca.ET.167.01.1.1]
MNAHTSICDQAALLYAEREDIFAQMETFGAAPIPADLADKTHMLIEAVSFARPITIGGVLACLHAAQHFVRERDNAEPDSFNADRTARARDRCLDAVIAFLEKS